MKYREVRRRIRLLRNCGYERWTRIEPQGFFKQWDCDDAHVRIICPWAVIFGDYNELIRFLHYEELRAERLLEEELQIRMEGGL